MSTEMGSSSPVPGMGPLVTVMSRIMGRGRGEAGAWPSSGLMLTRTGILETVEDLFFVSDVCLEGSGGRGGGGVNFDGRGGGRC